MRASASIMTWFIVLSSETIWLYYALVLFTGNQWSQGIESDGLWWLAAGVLGYALNAAAAGRVHYAFQLIGNAALLGFLLFQSWISTVPDGLWGYGIAVSAAVSFVFLRGATLVYRPPARMHMLRRFEANILFYLLFVLLFTVNHWLDDMFHVMFLTAILFSLLGLIFTMQHQASSTDSSQVEVRTVGRSGWFTGVVVFLFAGIALLCLLLLLPSIRSGLQSLAEGVWVGLKWIGTALVNAIVWLFSLLPKPGPSEGMPADLFPQTVKMPEQSQEEAVAVIPTTWLVGGLVVVGAAVAVMLLIRFLKHWQRPNAPMKVRRVVVTRRSLWSVLADMCRTFRQRLRASIRMRFPRFYYAAVYWHFRQLQLWGRKNGFPRLSHETAKEYVEKLIRQLPEEASTFTAEGRSYHVHELLRGLSRDYQAAYYGRLTEVDSAEHRLLIEHVRAVRLLKG